jgi:flagellar hook-associated protein 3 FlgL
MRISTSQIYERGVASIQQRQAELLNTQQRLASGRRVLTPSDDPVASAQALQLTQADEINSQFRINRDYADTQLSLAETALAQAVELVQDVREKAVAVGNGSYSLAERIAVSNDVQAAYEQLIGIANSTDAQGKYLFAGFQGSTQPFTRAAAGVQYVGDDGARLAQAGASRQIAVNIPGADAFERIRNGNGTFTWAASAANTGTGIIGPGSVADPTLITGDDYQIMFTVAAGVTTYDVVDTTTATTILTAQPYTDPTSITFDGMVVNLTGAPANGDSFTIVPSTDQSVFATLENLVGALNGGASGAALANSLGIALTDIDQALEQMLGQRALVGTRLREIDGLNSAGEQVGLQYKTARSELVDVDYAKAASDLALQQTSLEAAQQSFVRISGLSLFDYL